MSHPSFHLSLTVLVHYRSQGVFSLIRLGRTDSPRITRVPGYLGYLVLSKLELKYEAFTLWGHLFQGVFLSLFDPLTTPATPLDSALPRSGSMTPLIYIRAIALSEILRSKIESKGLGFSPFARRYLGNHDCFLFLGLLGCFGSASYPLARSARALKSADIKRQKTLKKSA